MTDSKRDHTSWSPTDCSRRLCAAPPQFCGQQLGCCSCVCVCLVFCHLCAKCVRPVLNEQLFQVVSNPTTAAFVPLATGYDFCGEGLICGENSECKNRNTKAECECRSGYASIHGDSTYCEGRTAGVRCLTGCQHFSSCSVLTAIEAVCYEGWGL